MNTVTLSVLSPLTAASIKFFSMTMIKFSIGCSVIHVENDPGMYKVYWAQLFCYGSPIGNIYSHWI